MILLGFTVFLKWKDLTFEIATCRKFSSYLIFCKIFDFACSRLLLFLSGLVSNFISFANLFPGPVSVSYFLSFLSSPVLFLTCCFSLLLTSQGTSGIHSMLPSFCTKKLFGSEHDCFKSLFPINARSVLGKVLRELGKNLSVAEFQQNMTIQHV